MLYTLIALAIPPMPAVAFTARYYGAGTSRYQVYVTDLSGKSRRALTKSTSDCGAVRWTGPKSLAWVVDGAKGDQLWVMSDVTKGMPVLVKSGQSIYAVQTVQPDTPNAALYNIDGANVTVIGSAVKPFPAMGKPDQKVFTFAKPNSSTKATISIGEGPYDWTLTVSDQGSETRHSDDNLTFIRAYPVSASGQLLLVTFSGNSTNRGSFAVQELDWATGSLSPVAAGADLDFRPSRPTYASASIRWLKPYGKGQVWVSTATVGNWQTGSKTVIGQGMADFTSISLRPSE